MTSFRKPKNYTCKDSKTQIVVTIPNTSTIYSNKLDVVKMLNFNC